jgi:hypothetical protein
MSKLHRMRRNNAIDSDNSDCDDDIEEDPILENIEIKHDGCVNRIKVYIHLQLTINNRLS